MAIDMKRFVLRFVEEARSHIELLENGLAKLERDPNEVETINTIFRSAHTIKGSSRMLKLITISETAHKLEDVLGALREGNIGFSSELGRLLLNSVDLISNLVDIAEKNEKLPEVNQQLCERLSHAAQGNMGDLSVQQSEPENKIVSKKQHMTVLEESSSQVQQSSPDIALKTTDTVRIQLSKLDELIKLMGEVVSSHALMQQRLLDAKKIEAELPPQLVNSDLSSNLKTFQKQLRDDVLAQQLLMEELHDKALIMRMLPLSIVFDPAARLIRELARSVGKNVECRIKGGEIELDRQMINKLSDPVVHLLRNAIDHGIEAPDIRQAKGKSQFGQVKLSAHQDGTWVVIVIQDDGAGLSIEHIRNKAVSKGVYTQAEADVLTEKEVIELIFQPGFSTNAIITDLSGRGVGMDVVKKTIVEDLQGVIDVVSNDQGTTFSLKLPLSLAIMRVLLCQVAGICFGFTAQYISTLVRVKVGDLIRVAERLIINHGSELIPVVSLASLLSLKESQPTKKEMLLVIVKTHNEKLALIINELIDELDMVIKPLPSHMQKMPLATGMVMTGKNELISILNVSQLIKRASQEQRSMEALPMSSSKQNHRHVLVIDDSLNTREIEKDVLEAHGYRVTTARDGIEGWQKACADHFDAILTDVEMPGMDGFSLTQRLRQDDKFRHIPIIIVTSREKEEDKIRGIEVGADAYIVKGDFEQSNLIETLHNLLV